MPTGSLAPDSPSRIVPAGSATSRLPSTENTTAGSVGATAVPTSRATYHSKPKRKCAATAAAATVRKVPSTPASITVASAPRSRLTPMCIPPSNRMIASATVTMRWTVRCGGASRFGTTAAATAAAATNSAGAGSWIRSLRRLDSTARSPTAAITAISAPNGPTSCTRGLLHGLSANLSPTSLPGTPMSRLGHRRAARAARRPSGLCHSCAVSSRDLYVTPVDTERRWGVDLTGDTRFTWEYDDGRARLLALYQKGKDKQWDTTKRIDWDQDVDVDNPLGIPEAANPLAGSDMWRKSPQWVKDSWRRHQIAWQFSQFLHGEQGAMITSARIVETVPDLDAKFYAATQTMDEARHAETYARFLKDKIGLMYPINANLQSLLKDTLSDSRWDMPYLGMQVLIEGLALAAFGLMRDMTQASLPKQILAYVMQDEARHVAFGRMALKDYYAEISPAEKAEREEFVIEGCYLMRDRIRSVEVWEHLGFPVDECLELTKSSAYMQMFQSHLFSRIVPIVKDIGLWSDKVQAAYADMGVLDMAGVDLAKLMEDDENTADRIEREHRELLVRKQEIDRTISFGATG